jgi:predicted enzyme related to lactoylglutathione lyase
MGAMMDRPVRGDPKNSPKAALSTTEKQQGVAARKRQGETIMANPFVHVELATDDPAKAKQFYQEMFAWKFKEMPEFDYTLIEVGEGVGEGVGGGMMKNPVPGVPSHWLAYVLVEDVRASTAKARELGANVVKDVTEVPGMGWFSVFIDPTGAALAMWQMQKKA